MIANLCRFTALPQVPAEVYGARKHFFYKTEFNERILAKILIFEKIAAIVNAPYPAAVVDAPYPAAVVEDAPNPIKPEIVYGTRKFHIYHDTTFG